MQTTQQAADLQTAIKKMLNSAAFERFVVQAVTSVMTEAEPACGTVVLPAKPLNLLRFSEGENYRVYQVTSKDLTCDVRMQCERTPDDKRYIGTWYGYETRVDSEGREWTRPTGRMVQNDFGMLVELPA